MSKEASSSNSDTKPKDEAVTDVDKELEKLLSREASAFQRDIEVERILKAFKLK
jgi:DnaJ homolog subfamily C member 8